MAEKLTPTQRAWIEGYKASLKDFRQWIKQDVGSGVLSGRKCDFMRQGIC